jgi:hypothetical protein
MDVISLLQWAAELAIAAIILYYVVELLPMPTNMKRVVQALIILVCVLAVLDKAIGRPSGGTLLAPRPLSPANPSIIR